MNWTFAGIATGVVIAGVAGGAIFLPNFRRAEAPAPGVTATPADDPRFDVLEKTLRSQQDAIARLESSFVVAERAAADASREAEKTRELLEDFLAAAGPRSGAGGNGALGTAADAAIAPGGAAPAGAPRDPGTIVPSGANGGGAPLDPRREEIRMVLQDIRAEERRKEEEREQQRRRDETGRYIQSISTRLNLTPQQQEQMTTLAIGRQDVRRAIMEEVETGKIERDDARKKMEEARTGYETQVQQVLHPEQYEELQKLRAEDEGGGRGGEGRRARAVPLPAPGAPGGGGT